MPRWFSKNYSVFIIVVVVITFAVLIFSKYYYARKEFSLEPISTPSHLSAPQVPTSTITSTMQETKIYRNEEWGFEFEYPEDWVVRENTFYNPFSKFNLVGAPIKNDYLLYAPSSPFLINIVTPDFAERAFYDLKNIISETSVEGVTGLKYEYEYEGLPRAAIILPFGQYKIILSTHEEFENIFNQILASFKFLK